MQASTMSTYDIYISAESLRMVVLGAEQHGATIIQPSHAQSAHLRPMSNLPHSTYPRMGIQDLLRQGAH